VRVGVVGSGYVGLVTGACLAELGHHVVCADVDATKVRDINAGESPIFEVGLGELLARNVGLRLSATTNVQEAVGDVDVAFLAVGTPLRDEVMDDRALLSATEQVGEAWRGRRDYPVLVVKSTVVPGTTERFIGPILADAVRGAVGEQVGLGANPEFLTEGRAVADFMAPDRIVIGANDDKSVDVISNLYKAFSASSILVTNTSTAEMIKYASNSLLATLISFSNEIANIGSAIGGIDVAQVMEGVHSSRYLTVVTDEGGSSLAPITSFLWAGCGYGGSCLPKDIRALAALARQHGELPRVLEAVNAVNAQQPERIISILKE
jgi:UDPglucose 6-dehydrogenase